MQTCFHQIIDCIQKYIQKEEIFTCYYAGEHSDFIRFNQGLYRQLGHVEQHRFSLRLIQGKRSVTSSFYLSLDILTDEAYLKAELARLRESLMLVPEDPYLLYAQDVHNSTEEKDNTLIKTQEIAASFLEQTRGYDVVGIIAAGTLYRGFANSFGQRNWYTAHPYSIDASLYHAADKAIKVAQGGFLFDPQSLTERLREAKAQVELLKKPAKNLKKGRYDAYLTPKALKEIISMMTWGGFSQKALETKQSPLLALQANTHHMHESISITENTAHGVAPSFQMDGFIKPSRVDLISNGTFKNALISPRTAQEYGMQNNGANAAESPESLEMKAGMLDKNAILKNLDTGIYIGNLWYLNFSDRMAGRLTGMTRFGTFWVENGEIVAPLQVMRFDDSVYDMLGGHLRGLTSFREFLVDESTYEERSTGSMHLPGALIENFNLTL